MLRIHFGNRIEKLADALAAELASAPPGAPLAPETIVVGHAGMDEWLKRALAERLGIAANLEFRQPAGFVWRMLRALDPELPRSSPLDRGPLVWRLYAVLTAAGSEQAPEIRRYLAGGDELKPFELAEALATVFEQYQIYRPEWIRGWGKDESAPDAASWQAELWRRVAKGAAPNPAQLYEDFARNAGRLAADNDLPARVSVFGISALAPVYLDLLAALAQTRDVYLFVPNPSRAYWGDVEPEKKLARWQLTEPGRAQYATTGHPLLSALGPQTRDFIELLHDASDESVSREHYEQPSGSTLLGRLQGDMLDLEKPEPAAVDADDQSVQIHVCHSRRREVEVLHDALLARFEADPALGPEDILVMAPNMDDYADHVAAVFGAVPEARRIPGSLTDRSVREEHPIPEAVLTLLDLPESRLQVSDVFGLLELPSVARGFGLDIQPLGRLRGWAEAAGIRWGLDGAHRESLGLPGEDGFTWRFGLDRLLAGYALAPEDNALWDGVAPWGEFEGQGARPLGALCTFVARLAEWSESLKAPRAPAEWAAAMRDLLSLFEPETPDEIAAVSVVRQAVSDLAEQAERAGFTDEVPRWVARAALAARLAVPRHPRPFLSGRVTFCALAPMRSIPAKIVWLLGMSEADFPRRGRPPGFDLIAEDPRRGDRARRSEDRALFLEALGAARESFQLSYVGRSERDDGELPPSVVVAELLDVLQRMGADLNELVQSHPLQPFSPRYRAKPRRGASYANEWLNAPQAEDEPKAFAPSGPLAREIEHVVTLEELTRALANPARAFQRALGIATYTDEALLEDDEPFALDNLGKWRVRDALLARWLEHGEGFDPQSCRAEFTARGWLPLGEAGRIAYDNTVAEAGEVVKAVRKMTETRSPETRDIALAVGNWQVRGRIGDVYPATGYVYARAGALRAKYRIAAWLRHLALAASGINVSTHCVGLEKKKGVQVLTQIDWQPVRDSPTRLGELCELYGRMQREALPLLPDLSLEFDDVAHKKGDDAAYRKVEASWNSDKTHAEGEEDYARVMRERELFGESFGELARAVFDPIRAAETSE